MSTSREVDNETMVGVNSRFAEVTENDILRMQDIRAKQCFNTQFAHMSRVFCPDR